VQNPEAYALDFVFVAVFTTLLMSLWRGKQDLAPWFVAAICAILAYQLLPGKWYIVIGGIGGALVPVFHQPNTESDTEGQSL
jgi:predicted branched-subunit amino acid permease